MYDYHYHCFDSTIILHIGLKLISQFESWISSWEGCWNGQISGLGKPILGLGQSPGCLALTASSFQIFGSYRCMWNPSNKNIYDDHEWMDDPNSGLVTWSFIDVSLILRTGIAVHLHLPHPITLRWRRVDVFTLLRSNALTSLTFVVRMAFRQQTCRRPQHRPCWAFMDRHRCGITLSDGWDWRYFPEKPEKHVFSNTV